MQFIKEFGIVDKDVQTKIISLTKKYTNNLQPSQLYSSVEERKFIDEEKRSSVFQAIVEPELFAAVEELIHLINQKDDFYEYLLIRNDVTTIQYSPGGFFKAHQDYLSYTSNMIEEFTLLMCADAQDCQGGRTIFHVNPFFTHISSESVTPLHCLLFRKDLKHEGELLTSGNKHIITINLLALPKTCETLIVVDFSKYYKKKNAVDNGDEKSLETTTTSERTQQKIYHLTISQVMACGVNFFSSLIGFHQANPNAGKMIMYEETMFSFEQFEIIYRIFNRCYISIEEYKLSKSIIEFFGITFQYLLLATDLNSAIPSAPQGIDFSKQIILHANETETRGFGEIVKMEGLPFIPFKLVLAEGSLVYGGGMSDQEPEILKMSPMWLSFGDLNNILFHKTLENTSCDNNSTLLKILRHSKYKSFRDFFELSKEKFQYYKITEDGDEKYDEESNTYFVENDDWIETFYSHALMKQDLLVCKPQVTNKEILELVMGTSQHSLLQNKSYFCPREYNVASQTAFYCLDKDGKMFLFGDQQLKQVIDVLKTCDFEETIKRQLKTTKFQFAQENKTLDRVLQ